MLPRSSESGRAVESSQGHGRVVASPGLSVKRHGCRTTATEEVAPRLKLEKWLELAISEFPEEPKVTGS